MIKPSCLSIPGFSPRDETFGTNDLFGNGHPLALRSGQVAREAFAGPHYNGMDGAEDHPEIYPVYQPAARPGDGGSCDVCGNAKTGCACGSW